jgi:surfactin family lipopeptide synthetase A
MLGYFLNVLVLRTDLSGDPTFVELMRRSFDELLNTLAHDGIPFEKLVKEICPKHDGNKNPLFQVLISFEPPLARLHPGWEFSQMDVETSLAKFDLHLELDEREEGLIGRFVYNCDLFDKATIVGMAETWRRILTCVVENPQQRLSQLASLRPERAPSPVAAQVKMQPAKRPGPTEQLRVPAHQKSKSFVRQILSTIAERCL